MNWDSSVGTVYRNLPYGEGEANRFDLCVPAERSRDSFSLVVCLHAGGFTSGDKADDHEMLKWLCSKGYVAAGINCTLRDAAHPQASVLSQSLEIRDSIPAAVAEAEKLGYHIADMGISGGSAGHCLAMLYAYRDADISPVPVRMVFGGAGPSSFYPGDWSCYGLDGDTEETPTAAAGLFSVMAGREITPEMIGTPAYDEAVRDISPLLWVNGSTVPSLMAYEACDRVQSFQASVRQDRALTEHGVPHDCIVFPHSGHGLQNDSREYRRYYQLIEEYLDRYLPV